MKVEHPFQSRNGAWWLSLVSLVGGFVSWVLFIASVLPWDHHRFWWISTVLLLAVGFGTAPVGVIAALSERAELPRKTPERANATLWLAISVISALATTPFAVLTIVILAIVLT